MCVKDWEQRMYLRLQDIILCLWVVDFVLLSGTNINLHIKRIILPRKLTSVTIQMCKFFEQPLILVVTCPNQGMWCSWPGRNGSTWGTPPRAWTPRTPAPPNPTFSSPKKLFSPVSKSVPSRQENVTTYMLSHWPPLYCGAHLSLARSCQRGDYHQNMQLSKAGKCVPLGHCPREGRQVSHSEGPANDWGSVRAALAEATAPPLLLPPIGVKVIVLFALSAITVWLV